MIAFLHLDNNNNEGGFGVRWTSFKEILFIYLSIYLFEVEGREEEGKRRGRQTEVERRHRGERENNHAFCQWHHQPELV